jgi:hypothetical protein
LIDQLVGAQLLPNGTGPRLDMIAGTWREINDSDPAP